MASSRGPSLDEFGGATLFFNFESLAASPVAPTQGHSVPENITQDAGTGEFINLHGLFVPPVSQREGTGVREMPMQMLAIDEFIHAKPCSVAVESDASTTVSIDEDQCLTTPPSGLSDDEGEAPTDTSATLKISLTDTLGLWSIGSAAHDSGTCKPCAFLWKDPSKPGCQNGQECVFCHLCPPGEVKRRKKQKMFMRKVANNLQYQDQFAMGFEPQFEPQYHDQTTAGFGMW